MADGVKKINSLNNSNEERLIDFSMKKRKYSSNKDDIISNSVDNTLDKIFNNFIKGKIK